MKLTLVQKLVAVTVKLVKLDWYWYRLLKIFHNRIPILVF